MIVAVVRKMLCCDDAPLGRGCNGSRVVAKMLVNVVLTGLLDEAIVELDADVGSRLGAGVGEGC